MFLEQVSTVNAAPQTKEPEKLSDNASPIIQNIINEMYSEVDFLQFANLEEQNMALNTKRAQALNKAKQFLFRELQDITTAQGAEINSKYQQFIYDYAFYIYEKFCKLCPTYLRKIPEQQKAMAYYDSEYHHVVFDPAHLKLPKVATEHELKDTVCQNIAQFVFTMEHEYAHFWDYNKNFNLSKNHWQFNDAHHKMDNIAEFHSDIEIFQRFRNILYTLSPEETYANTFGGIETYNFFQGFMDSFYKNFKPTPYITQHSKSGKGFLKQFVENFQCAQEPRKHAKNLLHYAFDICENTLELQKQRYNEYKVVSSELSAMLACSVADYLNGKKSMFSMPLCQQLLGMPGLYNQYLIDALAEGSKARGDFEIARHCAFIKNVDFTPRPPENASIYGKNGETNINKEEIINSYFKMRNYYLAPNAKQPENKCTSKQEQTFER